MKFQRRQGFTIVELLTVLAIIAILMGVFVPTLNLVRNTAKEAKQKAQLATINMALISFKGDYGDYPPSGIGSEVPFDYCGTQKLTEALLGWDLLGFHSGSNWKSDGSVYKPSKDNLSKRIGPYLELSTTNTFKLSDLFASYGNGAWELASETYVLCDSFGIKSVSYTTAKAGTPILYYKANPSSKVHNTGVIGDRIYNVFDNKTLMELKIKDPDRLHPLADDDGSFSFTYFYDYITDPKVTAIDWPYRPDSYILISAGVDGLYGTSDDICNF